jgi:hypothetical protein
VSISIYYWIRRRSKTPRGRRGTSTGAAVANYTLRLCRDRDRRRARIFTRRASAIDVFATRAAWLPILTARADHGAIAHDVMIEIGVRAVWTFAGSSDNHGQGSTQERAR